MFSRIAALVLIVGCTTASAQSGVMNTGLTGSWYDPSTPGQGLLLDVNEDIDVFFLTWFTFETAGGSKVGVPSQRWLSAQGALEEVASGIPLRATSGGVFDEPVQTLTNPVGTVTLNFESCTTGSLSYQFDDGLAGEISLVRLTPDIYCQAIVDATEPAVSISYVGNQGVFISDGIDAVLIDAIGDFGTFFINTPAGTQADIAAIAPPFDLTRAVMITHGHSDHYNTTPSIDFVRNSNQPPTLYIPNQNRAAFATLGESASSINPARFESAQEQIGNIVITVVNTRHFDQFGNDFSDTDNYVYIVEIGGVLVMHCGDIDYARDNFEAIAGASSAPLTAIVLPTFNTLVSQINADLVAEFFPDAQIIGAHLRDGNSLAIDQQAVMDAYPTAVIFDEPGESIDLFR